tara:strand:- start:395 stop:1930 length:1536 start_codon:yes stop_codon:yes gene_type:complete
LAKISSLAFSEIKDSLFSFVSQSATREIALLVFKHLHSLSIDFHFSRKTGALGRFMDRGTKGIEFLMRYVVFNIIPVIVEIILVCIIFNHLFGNIYSLITFCTIFTFVIVTLKITQWRLEFRKKLNKADNNVSNTILESLINFETVKYFGNEKTEFKRLNNHLTDYEFSANKNRTSLAFLNVCQNIVIIFGVTTLMLISASEVKKGDLTVGNFVVINTYLLQLYQPLNFLGSVYREIRQAIIDMENMFNLLKIKTNKKSSFENLNLKNNLDIEFKNVSFSYDGKRKILKKINLKIFSKQKVALVGPTGSGKTSILRLLFKFYENYTGDILINNQNLRNINEDSLRNRLGIIPQDIVMFNDSIFYNIHYGNLNSSKKDVIKAAKKAKIMNFIDSLPGKFNTVVGERGLKLSGGEKQRIAIARTLLKDPDIILLDEASSSLDYNTEKEIKKNLNHFSVGKTVLSIAHRLSSIEDYDFIYFLEKGLIVESGKHSYLIGSKGRYYEMWKSQKRKN